MFSNKNKTAMPLPGGTASTIGAGVTLTGDINSPGDIRIDGTLTGNIICQSRVFANIVSQAVSTSLTR